MGDLKVAITFAAATVLSLAFGGQARAQQYPEKPLRFVVGLSAGSLTDLSARALAKVAAKYLDKPIIVTNATGAGQTVAMNEIANAQPDGHTMGMMTSSYQNLTIHMQKVPFDPKVLKPLLGYAELRYVLFVKADSPYAKFEDFIAYGKKNPGVINFGHSGRGTGIQVVGIAFFRNAGIQATDIPYKGSIDYLNAVLGGNLFSGVVDVSGVAQQARGGKVKLVVSFTEERMPEFPDVPTAREKGFPDLNSLNTLLCIVLHKDVPADRARVLHDALRKTTEDPELLKVLADMGLKGGYVPAATVQDMIVKAEKIGLPLLKELNLLSSQ